MYSVLCNKIWSIDLEIEDPSFGAAIETVQDRNLVLLLVKEAYFERDAHPSYRSNCVEGSSEACDSLEGS